MCHWAVAVQGKLEELTEDRVVGSAVDQGRVGNVCYAIVVEDGVAADRGVRVGAIGEQTEVASDSPRIQLAGKSGHSSQASRDGKEGGEDLGHGEGWICTGDDV